MKKKHLFANIIKTVLAALLVIVAFLVLMLLILTVMEYRPKAEEDVAITNPQTLSLKEGDELTLLSWNIGFGCLYEGADFFMDGGDMVAPSDRAQTLQNLDSIEEALVASDSDIIFLQEIDKNADRSHHIDQIEEVNEVLQYESAYAVNFRAVYIPYPVPPIGRVDSGIVTMSRYAETDATRIQLPVPFSWPLRLGNLKRCLLVTRIPVEGTDKELVLVNLHLEAYDSGEGKEAQTQMLKELLVAEAEKGNYVIAGGDFNQTFSGADTSAYPAQEGKWEAGFIDEDAFGEAFLFFMDTEIPSCRSLDKPYAGADHETFQYYVIDGFIVSSSLEVTDMHTIDLDFVASDHNPIRLSVRIP